MAAVKLSVGLEGPEMLTEMRAAMIRGGRVAAVLAIVLIVIGAWAMRAQHRNANDSAKAAKTCSAGTRSSLTKVTDAYDRKVLSLDPAMYLTMGHSSATTEPDLSGNGHTGNYEPSGHHPLSTTLPNGDLAAQFDGQQQYLQVPSAKDLSVPMTGCLTIQAWVKPTTLQFPHEEGTGYVYMLGKGEPNEQEYALRMYSEANSENPPRPNRISGYAYNLSGGLGSGAYFQHSVQANAWIMVTVIIDAQASASWSDGYVAIYKNGQLRQQVSLSQFGVKPQAAAAPLRIGTRNFDSYFQGAIGKVAIFDYPLTQQQIASLYSTM